MSKPIYLAENRTMGGGIANYIRQHARAIVGATFAALLCVLGVTACDQIEQRREPAPVPKPKTSAPIWHGHWCLGQPIQPSHAVFPSKPVALKTMHWC
ncbi:hypothetical protein [Chitinimonas sp. BJB300]|uniref:hypothetical protein n=1 Tax=Chitinimonas sp. BJB300 TaxID=1559339 RepID=UPI001111FFF3|nr:hypothetical protein [Chitinimonas sp. BJB300]TSJ90160.1 hypothetical protein FG002_008295 [Chitinimonas sp. BJB300]